MTSTTRTDRIQALCASNEAFDPASFSAYGGQLDLYASPPSVSATKLSEDDEPTAPPAKAAKAKKSVKSKPRAKGVLSQN